MNQSRSEEKDQNGSGLVSNVKIVCDVRLRKWANYLSRKAERIPEQKLARTLIAIFLIIELSLICRLVYLYKHTNEAEVRSIRAPVRTPPYQPSVDQTALKRIKSFHRYLDSIQLHNEPLYDSLIAKRPHLIDSIIIIERFTNE